MRLLLLGVCVLAGCDSYLPWAATLRETQYDHDALVLQAHGGGFWELDGGLLAISLVEWGDACAGTPTEGAVARFTLLDGGEAAGGLRLSGSGCWPLRGQASVLSYERGRWLEGLLSLHEDVDLTDEELLVEGPYSVDACDGAPPPAPCGFDP